jgi:peptidoglycan/LPS O-acetylase OafA/YrhL
VLTINSVLPYFAIMALLLLVAQAVAVTVPFYRDVLRPQPSRYDVLDGLRGFLALSVFLLHSVSHYYYARIGKWGEIPAVFYIQMGQVGVMCFFMLTGFLFWGKAIDSGARVKFIPLMKNRFRRLAPLYYAMAACVIALVFLENPHLTAPPKAFATGLLQMASVSMVWGWGKFNGVDRTVITSGVVWTLTFEWFFYLLLPLTGRLATPRRVWFLLVPAALAAAFAIPFSMLQQSEQGGNIPLPNVLVAMLLPFALGMSAAHLARNPNFKLGALAGRRAFGLVPVVAITSVVLLTGARPLIHPLGHLLVWAALLSFIYGCDVFGLLRTRAARLLSTVSYSTYLLHGIVLYVVLRLTVNPRSPIDQMEPAPYWLLIAGCGVVVVLLSSLTYAVIEHPFIRHKPAKPAAAAQAAVREPEPVAMPVPGAIEAAAP